MKNYEKVLKWAEENIPSHLIPQDERGNFSCTIQHDEWCDFWSNRKTDPEMRCNCSPTLLIGNEKIDYPKEILK